MSVVVLADRKQIRFLNDLLFQTGSCVVNKTTGEIAFPTTLEDTGETITRFPLDNTVLPVHEASTLVSAYKAKRTKQIADGSTLPATASQIARALKMSALLGDEVDESDVLGKSRPDLDTLCYVLGARLHEARTKATADLGIGGFVAA